MVRANSRTTLAVYVNGDFEQFQHFSFRLYVAFACTRVCCFDFIDFPLADCLAGVYTIFRTFA